jgi:hypothetical protein
MKKIFTFIFLSFSLFASEKNILSKITKAIMIPSCGPTDGPAIMILLKPEKENNPSVSIQWWANDRAYFKNGTYEFQASDEKKMNDGFSIRLCPTQEDCKSLKSLKIKVQINSDQGPGIFDYKFKTLDDKILEGTLPLELIKETKNRCG